MRSLKPRKDLPNEFSELYILDKSIYDCLDAFMVLLMQAAEFSLLPDILAIFGPEMTVKFIDIFSGTQIKVPNRDILQSIVRDATIYNSMKNSNNQNHEAKKLAEMYDVTEKIVNSTYERVSKMIEENTRG